MDIDSKSPPQTWNPRDCTAVLAVPSPRESSSLCFQSRPGYSNSPPIQIGVPLSLSPGLPLSDISQKLHYGLICCYQTIPLSFYLSQRTLYLSLRCITRLVLLSAPPFLSTLEALSTIGQHHSMLLDMALSLNGSSSTQKSLGYHSRPPEEILSYDPIPWPEAHTLE